MKITFWKGVFVADHKPGDDERLLKHTGFVLHEPTLCEPSACRGCRARIGRRYWSDRVEHATRLRKYCLPRALQVMEKHLAKLASSRAVDAKIFVPAPPGESYRPYQKAGIAYAISRKDTLFGDDMGVGKALTLSAKILVPTGWTTMGEIKKGDLVVGSDGRSYPVTGVYPQGVRQVYRVTFQDGASTKCDAEHLWEVNTPLRVNRGYAPRVLTTQQMMDAGLRDSSNNRRHFVRLVKPPNFSRRRLFIDPYVMGYLLGNGSLSQDSVRVTIPDTETIDRLSSLLPRGIILSRQNPIDFIVTTPRPNRGKNNLFLNQMRRLGLMGHLTHEKFVPPEYMWTTKKNRVALLQGLVDSDGHVSPIHGNIGYSSSSPQLARDVQQLIWSLGGIAKIHPKKTKRRLSYWMSVTLPNDVVPCRLSRKLANHRTREKYPPTRSIDKIERVGLEETQCIRVDSPDHLYVTDDFILTHNTIESLGFANIIKPRSILIVGPATLALNWKIEAEKWLVNKYRYFIPDDCSEEVPQTDEPLCVITNYEKITGTTPRRQRVPLSAIEPDPSSSNRLAQASVEQLTVLANSAQKNPDKSQPPRTPLLCADPGRPGRLRAVKEEIVVEAARVLGWPRLTAIVLPPGTSTQGIDDKKILKKIMRTTQHTPLSRSLLRSWDLGIFDEAQALKNPESQRSRAVLGKNGLYYHAHRNLFLSGTPLENCPIEIWPIAAAVCPAKFGNWQDFAHRYCGLHAEERAGKSVWVYNGSTNHSELQQRLRTTFMIRRLKTDIMRELPPKCRQLIVLDEKIDWSRYPEFQRWRELYEQAYDNALAHVASAQTQLEYLSAIRKLSTVTVGFTESSELRHKTALLKLPACLRHADEMLSAGLDCLVIYAHHRDVLEQVHEHYGDQSCVMYGDTPVNDRIPMVQEFQAGRKKIFIGGLRAAGTGITLTRASVVDFFETDWNPATVKQGEDRLWRYGQKKMVHAIFPVLDGSLDCNILQKMLKKQEAVDKVLDRMPEQVLNPRPTRSPSD